MSEKNDLLNEDEKEKVNSTIANTLKVAKGVEIASEAPEDSIRASSEDLKQAPASVQQHVKESMYDPMKIVAAIERNKKAKAEGGQSSLKDEFLTSLTFFLPEIIGGAVGSIGGGEGALQGMQIGGKLGAQFRDYKMKMADRLAATQDRGKVDITANFVTPDGKPLYTRQVGDRVEMIDDTGRTYTKGDAVPLQSYIQAPREKRLSKQFDTSMAFKRLQEGKLSEAQVNSNAEYDNALAAIGRINNLFDSKEVGPVISRINRMAELADMAPAVAVKLNSEATNARLAYQRATSGLTVNKAEMNMIDSIIPSDKDMPGVFMAKLETFRDIINASRESLLVAIETGQPMKMETVRAIRERIKKGEQQIAKAEKEASSKKTSNRKQAYADAVKNAKTKEELEEVKKRFGAR